MTMSAATLAQRWKGERAEHMPLPSAHEDTLVAALLLGSLLVLVETVHEAAWVQGPSLTPIIIAAVLTGLLVSKTHGRYRPLAHLGASALGVVLVYWSVSGLAAAPSLQAALLEINQRLSMWWRALADGGFSTDTLPFAVSLAVLAWVIGYASTWAVIMRRNLWLGVLPGAIALLTTLSYLPDNFSFHLFLYTGLVLLLGVQLHSYQQRLRWAQEKVAYPPSTHASAITLGISGIFVIILVAAFVPVRAPMVDWLHEGWDWLRTPVTHIEDNISRAFIALPSRTGATYRSFGDYLAFQGPISLSDDPYFLLDAEVPLYLRSRAYPVYTAQGWIANDTAEIEGPDLPPFEPAPESGQLTAEYTVTSLVSTTGLPVSALPVEAPEETTVLVQAPKRFLIPADPDTRIADDLPSDLSAAVSVLRQEDGGEGTVRDPDVLLRALPDNVTVTSLRFRENGDEEDVSIPPDAEGSVLAAALAEHPGRLMWIEVTRREPAPLDALGLSSSDPYSPGDAYTLTSLFSDATPDELRLAGTAYPAWVTDTYLQLPDTLPQRVRALAEAITADRPTPYGKAAAVVGFLHSIPYDQDIPAPAFDADGVDHFLFEVGRGYSQYFGSTMAVLMRASGVPARLVIGYAPREQDPDTGVWIVRERDSHGWAEVYFPGYGWVEFEPTPGRDGLASADDGTPVTGSPGVSFPDEFFDEDDEFLEGPGLPPGSGSQTPSPDTFGTVLRIIAGIAGGLLALGLLGYAYFAAFVSTPAPRAIFQRMSRLGALTGLRYRRQQTPLEYGRRLAQALPRAGEDATFLCDVFTKARYGTGPLEPWESERLGTAWRNVQRALLRRAFRHNPILG